MGNGLLNGLFNGNNTCGCQKNNCCNDGNQTVTIDSEELYLERQMCANNLANTKQYYQGVVDFNKSLTDGFFAAYEEMLIIHLVCTNLLVTQKMNYQGELTKLIKRLI